VDLEKSCCDWATCLGKVAPRGEDVLKNKIRRSARYSPRNAHMEALSKFFSKENILLSPGHKDDQALPRFRPGGTAIWKRKDGGTIPAHT
jgi:hypothetical protein